jgi:hypothetical protein
MPQARVAPSKKSRGKPPFRAGNKPPGRGARAHRDDTPEATTQRRRARKTHPTRARGAMRKDKRAGPSH